MLRSKDGEQIWEKQRVFCGWEKEESRIDELELQAVLAALQSFPIAQTHKVIRARVDNTVAVAYINHMGGRIPRLNRIARKIWAVLEENDAFLIATYIPTHENPADELTRGLVSNFQMRDIRQIQIRSDDPIREISDLGRPRSDVG
jgi:hypothetical protein